MLIRSLKIGDKTYTTGKITAYISRKALEINTESLAITKAGSALKDSEGDRYEELESYLRRLAELRTSRSWLVCEAYEKQFTIEELENGLSVGEIEAEVLGIVHGVSSVIEKNV